MPFPESADDKPAAGRLLELLCLLWLAGMATRITILAVPPVIPLIRHDLQMTETQVGALIGLPLLTWALAAVPGSLLIARFGAPLSLTVGVAITGLAAACRGAAPDVSLLYLATLVMGFGIAITHPAVPTLVQQWLPHRIGLGAAVYTNGMMIGIALGPALTIPLVLPLAGQSWRLDLLAWSAPVLLTALLFLLVLPRSQRQAHAAATGRHWWPDWKNPLLWLLGLTFRCNNAVFYGTNAFLPEYLIGIGRADISAPALAALNGGQLVASTLLLVTAEHVQRRTWPYLVFGPASLAGVLAILGASGGWVVAAAGLLGFSLSVTFVVTFALLPVLSLPDEIHRMSAGMFTIGFCCAVILPILCGLLWDLTGRSWTAFVPLGACVVTLTVLGVVLSLHQPPATTAARR